MRVAVGTADTEVRLLWPGSECVVEEIGALDLDLHMRPGPPTNGKEFRTCRPCPGCPDVAAAEEEEYEETAVSAVVVRTARHRENHPCSVSAAAVVVVVEQFWIASFVVRAHRIGAALERAVCSGA